MGFLGFFDCLGQPLHLQSIGMGYGKRITFASEKRNGNENYFWSDNYPSGYGFSIHVISVGEKFTIYDANHLAIGTCEIIEVDVNPFPLACSSVDVVFDWKC